MKEYTTLALLSAVVVAAVDRLLGTRLLRRRDFWMFIGVMTIFLLVANGYLTWRPIVVYGERFFLGWRIGTIPLEDFLFGFSLMSLTIVLWEYFTTRDGKGRKVGE